MISEPEHFRPDQAEQELTEARADGRLLEGLGPELLQELHGADLLQPLLRRRLQGFLLDAWGPAALDAPVARPEEDPRWPVLARSWFEAQVDRRYLERRDGLERVAFRLLRTPSKGVVLEAQQRLRHREEEWVVVSERWGIDPEKRFNGRIAPTAPSKLAPELAAALRRLQPGELSEPIRLGKVFALVELEQWQSVDLTDELRRQLEQEMLESWLQQQLSALISSLNLQERTGQGSQIAGHQGGSAQLAIPPGHQGEAESQA